MPMTDAVLARTAPLPKHSSPQLPQRSTSAVVQPRPAAQSSSDAESQPGTTFQSISLADAPDNRSPSFVEATAKPQGAFGSWLSSTFPRPSWPGRRQQAEAQLGGSETAEVDTEQQPGYAARDDDPQLSPDHDPLVPLSSYGQAELAAHRAQRQRSIPRSDDDAVLRRQVLLVSRADMHALRNASALACHMQSNATLGFGNSVYLACLWQVEADKQIAKQAIKVQMLEEERNALQAQACLQLTMHSYMQKDELSHAARACIASQCTGIDYCIMKLRC